jgi:hypothetical protein
VLEPEQQGTRPACALHLYTARKEVLICLSSKGRHNNLDIGHIFQGLMTVLSRCGCPLFDQHDDPAAHVQELWLLPIGVDYR